MLALWKPFRNDTHIPGDRRSAQRLCYPSAPCTAPAVATAEPSTHEAGASMQTGHRCAMRHQMLLGAGGSVTRHYRVSGAVAAAALRGRCQVAQHPVHVIPCATSLSARCGDKTQPSDGSTEHRACLLPSTTCRKTYEKNQGQIARRGGSVWTVRGRESFAAATGGTWSPKPPGNETRGKGGRRRARHVKWRLERATETSPPHGQPWPMGWS